ncbi:permease [Caldicoprobacter algeriensis]|uniref:permease n=1 Tax=Caldicoprobacter algeriensis TaxID=699281 RepID=UPI00207982C1|nr:permease [Caldicoprobacter algeriensis]MCM8900279.1 permease [Caldicoprobacter algeriensis]
MKEWKKFALIVGVFLAAYCIPFSHPRVSSAILEAFYMLQEYAREHVLFCLVPALFIAGAISNFISQAAVIKYFGGQAKKWVSYAVASVSGTILAVCSCTVLPLFAGIYKRGAGIGPAIAFLYSGPAINILAIILTARVLGWELGIARAIGAVLFSIIIGLIMAAIYRKEDEARTKSSMAQFVEEAEGRSPLQNIIYFASLVFILIFAAWGKPAQDVGFFMAVYRVKWYLTAFFLIVLGYTLVTWFNRDERISWVEATWSFAKQILPLLFGGVLVAGFLMGRPNIDAGIIPSKYISAVVGGNSLLANLVASVVGAFMYFATLTEVPILQGLLGSGMGKGPALALLLAGPALSLPSMLVIRSVLGTKKTIVYVSLVIIFATITGMIFGFIVG